MDLGPVAGRRLLRGPSRWMRSGRAGPERAGPGRALYAGPGRALYAGPGRLR
ncbi:hypothetical protein Plo01_72940 [Planobispora longispora]|uniref:Uncharacterized protein n=1 Tax=Planobispora longispora TaxID=28887 RepID=A0A8J3RT50_9ACTN|nr:hypothetical protein Plo01_72940 [Planobispora longispora]